MKIDVLDDYQDVVRSLDCFRLADGHDVTIWNDHTDDIDILASRLANTEALLLIRERTAIDARLLNRLPRLKLISQFGGVPHIDVRACRERGVVVCSRTVPGQPSYATAELTWGLIIAAARRIPQEAAALKAGIWQTPGEPGRVLRGRTLGIYGYGRIGAVLAGYGQAFGMKVLVWGRTTSAERAKADGFDVAHSADALFETSDVLTLHLPLNAATRGIVTWRLLGKMRPDAMIVNTSRAQLVEDGALVRALQAGRPGLAALDVFETEPMLQGQRNPLLALPNVVATPHLGYVERDSLERMFGLIFEQVRCFDEGKPINVVEPV